VIGLRAGRAVLDTPVAALDRDDTMALYAKVGAAQMPARAAVA